MKRWQIAHAKAQLSEVIHNCVEEPQMLFNRNKAVAVMISLEDFEVMEEKRREALQPSMDALMDELERINQREADLEVPVRSNRALQELE